MSSASKLMIFFLKRLYCFFLLALLIFCSCSQPNNKLRIGLIAPSTDWLPLALAWDKDIIAEQDLKIHYFSSGWEVNEALISDRIDIAIMPFTYAWKDVSEGKNVRIVSFFERESDGIIADSRFETVEQLHNKKLGVLKASTLDIFAHLLIDKYNIRPEIISFRTPTEMAVAFESGYVDALSFYVPPIFKTTGNIVKWYSDEYPLHPCCDIVAAEKALIDKNKEIGNLLNKLRLSCSLIDENKDIVGKILAERYNLSPEIASLTLKHTKFALSFDLSGQLFQLLTAKKMLELGYLRRLPDPGEVYYYGYQQ